MREKIKLLSSAGTGHFYVTMKNKRLHPEKLETKKYDPVVRKHVPYKETKIKEPPAGRTDTSAVGGNASALFFWRAPRAGGTMQGFSRSAIHHLPAPPIIP